MFPVSQVHLKEILTALVSRRKAYRLRDGHFQYAFGSDVTPRPYLKNSLPVYLSITQWHVSARCSVEFTVHSVNE